VNLLQNDCTAIAQRSHSDYEAVAKRLQSGLQAIAKLLYSTLQAIKSDSDAMRRDATRLESDRKTITQNDRKPTAM
jgi:uncharacterized membrane protein YccC